MPCTEVTLQRRSPVEARPKSHTCVLNEDTGLENVPAGQKRPLCSTFAFAADAKPTAQAVRRCWRLRRRVAPGEERAVQALLPRRRRGAAAPSDAEPGQGGPPRASALSVASARSRDLDAASGEVRQRPLGRLPQTSGQRDGRAAGTRCGSSIRHSRASSRASPCRPWRYHGTRTNEEGQVTLELRLRSRRQREKGAAL